MAVFSVMRAALAVSACSLASSFRSSSKNSIAGVPIMNAHLANGGEAGIASTSTKGDWVLVANSKANSKQIDKLCQSSECTMSGHTVPFLKVKASYDDLKVLIEQSEGALKFVEPDVKAYATPEFASTQAASWGLDKVGVATRTGTGEGVYIYVLDTGVRVTHTDLAPRAASALDLTSNRIVECNGDSACAQDIQGHGTHCAGSAAGTSYGVAPMASIRSVKVLGDDGSGSFGWTYAALDWIAEKGQRPAVASMSLGGQAVLAAMGTAVDEAVAAGVTVVVAAGNSNTDACGFSPAYVANAITIGSSDDRDRRSWFSNYGTCTDMWAPGTDIISASHRSDSGSAKMSGTSMACPHVSGGAALVLQANPSWSPLQVREELLANSRQGTLSDLKRGDTNAMLYVGE